MAADSASAAEAPPLWVRVQERDFDPAELQRELLRGDCGEGAVATFTGYVRAQNQDREVRVMELEHYPGMTEKSIEDILQQAARRWPLLAAGVVHRVGPLHPGDQIVWVGISSAHRGAAFSACEFAMDYLKTGAPLWKKEYGAKGDHWVESRAEDGKRARRWNASGDLP